MTKRIKIPDSIEGAENRLAALDGIATATGWERAAIVFAFTYEGKPGPKGNGREPVRSPHDHQLHQAADQGLVHQGVRDPPSEGLDGRHRQR